LARGEPKHLLNSSGRHKCVPLGLDGENRNSLVPKEKFITNELPIGLI